MYKKITLIIALALMSVFCFAEDFVLNYPIGADQNLSSTTGWALVAWDSRYPQYPPSVPYFDNGYVYLKCTTGNSTAKLQTTSTISMATTRCDAVFVYVYFSKLTTTSDSSNELRGNFQVYFTDENGAENNPLRNNSIYIPIGSAVSIDKTNPTVVAGYFPTSQYFRNISLLQCKYDAPAGTGYPTQGVVIDKIEFHILK